MSLVVLEVGMGFEEVDVIEWGYGYRTMISTWRVVHISLRGKEDGKLVRRRLARVEPRDFIRRGCKRCDASL